MAGEDTQRLTLEAQTKGFPKAAGEIDRITDAQERLRGAVGKSSAQQQDAVESTEDLNEAQTGLRGSTNDLLNLLFTAGGARMRIFGRSVYYAARAVGDLGQRTLTFKGIISKTAEQVKHFGSTLKFVFAGTAVVVGIMAIVETVRRMREEFDKATEAIRRQQDALNELKQQEQDRQQQIEDIADLRRRGGFDVETAPAAARAAGAIQKRFGEALRPENINEAVANLFDVGLSREQLAQAAILIQTTKGQPGGLQLDPRMGKEAMRTAFESAYEYNRERVETFTRREAAQQRKSVAEAIREARAGGTTISVQEFIKGLPGAVGKGEDPERLAAAVAGLGALEGQEVPTTWIPRLVSDAIVDAVRGQSAQALNLETAAKLLEREVGIEGATPQLVRSAEFILQQLNKAEREPAAIEVHNTYNQQNMKRLGPTARTQRREITNGATRLRKRAG